MELYIKPKKKYKRKTFNIEKEEFFEILLQKLQKKTIISSTGYNSRELLT